MSADAAPDDAVVQAVARAIYDSESEWLGHTSEKLPRYDDYRAEYRLNASGDDPYRLGAVAAIRAHEGARAAEQGVWVPVNEARHLVAYIARTSVEYGIQPWDMRDEELLAFCNLRSQVAALLRLVGIGGEGETDG